MTHLPTSTSVLSGGRTRSAIAAAAAAVAMLVATACQPAPPPDGRDLGLTFDTTFPAAMLVGEVATVSGTITNYGTTTASEVSFTYGAAGFDVNEVWIHNSVAGCNQVSPTQITCAIGGLDAGESMPLLIEATASTVGTGSHVLGVGSDGTEPATDTHPNSAIFSTEVGARGESALIPVGGVGNFVGTGMLLDTAGIPGLSAERFTLAVSPFCTEKVNGDRFQSGYEGTCAGAPNDEYRASGYRYNIDIADNRAAALDVLLWDARYNEDALPSGEPAIDDLRQAGQENFTYRLYSADSTPFDDSDNPLLCEKTFGHDSAFDLEFLGSQRWNNLCMIPTSAPPGRYLLEVTNGGTVTSPEGDGANQFGIVVRDRSRALDAPTVLCDRSTDTSCPVISGAGDASLRLLTDGVTDVNLGRIPADQAGATLNLELFDPGEGAQRLQVLAPAGPNSWAPMSFSWTSDGASGSGTSLSLVGGTTPLFNGKVVSIAIDLDGYAPPVGNDVWKVRFEAYGSVLDHSTWSARVTHP